ncbi:MAG: hypothetical protein J6Y68_01460 [Clostridia bacterium]|nr:hypothetical protein [Clostridia bacterium]MBP5593252.1 hypothetical protein [Clostridia bacterium]
MKKAIRISAAVLLVVLALSLIACGSVSKDYADKINNAAKNKEHLTYSAVIGDLGDPAVNGVATLGGSGESGVCIWYKGCKTVSEAKEKKDKGEKIESITITFLDGKATAAVYLADADPDAK